MRFIDICAGIGGFRAGLEKAGHECIGYVEIDKYARKSYEAMYDTKNEWTATDVTKIDPREIPKADLWTFGFPCQDISVSGPQKGLKGERSGIFYSIVKLIKSQDTKDRPEWLFIENVKNLLSLDGGRNFTEVLSEISEAGYDAGWYLINSKDHGVPQNRERVFIIGHLRERGTGQLLSFAGKSEQAYREAQSEQQTRKGQEISKRQISYKEAFDHYIGNRKYQNSHVYGINGVSRACMGTSEIYYAVPKIKPIIQGTTQKEVVFDSDGITRTLTATDYKEPKRVAVPKQIVGGSQAHRVYDSDRLSVTIKAEGGGVGAKTGLYAVPKVNKVLQSTQHYTVIDSDGLSPTVAACDYKDPQKVVIPCLSPDRINKRQNGRRFKENQDPMFTLTTQDRHGVLIYKDKEYYIRRLTPRECFRLQGFSDEQFDKAEKVNSNTQLYKQAGNAVTVNVAYELGLILKEVENEN